MAKISINQLAEYIVSSPSKRQAIIRDQLRPPVYKVGYYDIAKKTVSNFISNGMKDEGILEQAIKNLEQAVSQTEQEEKENSLNIQAIDSFWMSYDKINLIEGCTFKTIPKSCPKLLIENVEISVLPDNLFSGTYRRKEIIGAVKLYIRKNDPLNELRGSYTSLLLQKWLLDNNDGSFETCKAFCQTFDIFGGDIHLSPSAFIMRMRDVTAACKEINMWWNELSQNI